MGSVMVGICRTVPRSRGPRQLGEAEVRRQGHEEKKTLLRNVVQQLTSCYTKKCAHESESVWLQKRAYKIFFAEQGHMAVPTPPC